MGQDLKTDIEFELRKNLTNAICLSGAVVSIMKTFVDKSKYVSKKKMKALLKKQLEYLLMIEKSKNEILLKLD